jgi:DNA-binding transcriptional regulator LsrR (DeoR family)
MSEWDECRCRNEKTAGPAALLLAATVARRDYLEGATKSEIAAELGLSRFKVARLLEGARASGIVRIELESRGEVNLDLSVRLRAAYRLRHCVVVDCPDDEDEVFRTHLGPGHRRAPHGDHRARRRPRPRVGPLAHGDAGLPAAAEPLRSGPAHGGAAAARGRREPYRARPRRGRGSDGQAFYFYAPMILPDAGTAQILRTQPEIARAIARFPDVTKAVVGVGAWEAGQSTVADALPEQERRERHELGVRAEISSIQIDAEGRPVTTSLTERLVGIGAEQLRAVPDVIAIVYGAQKAAAVHAPCAATT